MKTLIPARRHVELTLIVALCVALSVHVQGCSAVGFLLGTMADERAGNGGPALLLDVKVGRPVTLQMWDGRTLAGRFAGWSRDSVSGPDSAAARAGTAPPDSSGLYAVRNAKVRLATEQGEIVVPAEGIAKVSTPVVAGRVTGLLIGLGIDALVIAQAREAAEHPISCRDVPDVHVRTAPFGMAHQVARPAAQPRPAGTRPPAFPR